MKIGLGLAAISVAALTATPSFAHDEHGSAAGPAPTESTTQQIDSFATGPSHFFVGLDWVMGFGKVDAIEQQTPSSTQLLPGNVLVSTKFRTQTYMLGAHYAFDSFGIGARFPMTSAHIADFGSGISGADVFASGGLELSADLPVKFTEMLKLVPELAIVLPTAGGDAPPSAATLANASSSSQFDKYASYRYSANLAAAAAHGDEDDALFWPGRLGVVPKLKIALKLAGLSFDPFVKIPVMIDTHSSSDERLRLEGVAGFRLSYAVTSWFEPAVRAWTTVPLAAQTGTRGAVVVVEPELRFHTPENGIGVMLAGVLPVAGALTNPYVGGARAALWVSF